jgi:hypothetical protein
MSAQEEIDSAATRRRRLTPGPGLFELREIKATARRGPSVIDPPQIREVLIRSLTMLRSKRVEPLAGKHGNTPM